MMNTKTTGDIGESAIIHEFLYNHVPVYLPFGDNEACDIIADFNGSLQRVQIKTCTNIVNGVIKFSLNSRRYKTDYVYNITEVNYFALYCIENRSCYLIENTSTTNRRSINLRVSEVKNGQGANVRKAENYLLSKVLNGLVAQ